MVNATRAPAYFISHGGPPTMFEQEHAAYRHWQAWGREVRDLHRAGTIKALVFVSAHWQAEDLAQSQAVYVNTNSSNPLVYDFYNFPRHYYAQKLTSNNPESVSANVIKGLRSQGVEVHKTDRGVDHGVWCPLKVAFQLPYVEDLCQGEKQPDPASVESKSVLPDTLPLVQVSLPRSESSIDALRLGKALRSLRDQGYAIVGGGMSVHNLGDFMRSGRGVNPTSYSGSFLGALSKAMTVPPATEDEERWTNALQLEKRPDFVPSHPTPEHFLPVLVALGAAHADEQGVESMALDQGPLGWSMYRWG